MIAYGVQVKSFKLDHYLQIMTLDSKANVKHSKICIMAYKSNSSLITKDVHI